MIEFYRIIACRSNGSVVETRRCLHEDIDRTHDQMHEIPTVRIVHTMGPFLANDLDLVTECDQCGSVIQL